MARLNVAWTNTAVEQRNYIFKYWNNRNSSNSYSVKLKREISQRIELLKTNPKLGKATDFNKTRTVSLGHYSLFYQERNNTRLITAFWDNRQAPSKLLDIIKK